MSDIGNELLGAKQELRIICLMGTLKDDNEHRSKPTNQ